jgi:hypothetical protein
MVSTKEDLAALLITLSPSLRSLSLISIVLATSPCSSMNRSGRFIESYFWLAEDDPVANEPWYELIVMMNKILNLQECVLRFGYLKGHDSEEDNFFSARSNSHVERIQIKS